MINREDMLELTRRMTLSRNCFYRAAGAYMDPEGYIDNSFNVNFRNMGTHDKQLNLELAKTIPFSKTNQQLRSFEFPKGDLAYDSIHRLLMALSQYGLKDDLLVQTLCEQLAEGIHIPQEYGIFVYHGLYDVPVKGSDKEEQGDSEEVFRFIICAVARVDKDYNAAKPELGFLFPAFENRSSDPSRIDIYSLDPEHPDMSFVNKIIGKMK